MPPIHTGVAMQNLMAKCTKAMNEMAALVVAEQNMERQGREKAEKRVEVLESMNEIAEQEIAECVAELEGERRTRKEAEMRVASIEKQVLCVVCLTRERSVVFLPCFHLVSCDVCQYGVHECPVCRKPVDSRVKAMLA